VYQISNVGNKQGIKYLYQWSVLHTAYSSCLNCSLRLVLFGSLFARADSVCKQAVHIAVWICTCVLCTVHFLCGIICICHMHTNCLCYVCQKSSGLCLQNSLFKTLSSQSSRTLLQKIEFTQLVKKFTIFYGTQWIQPTPLHPISLRSIPILSSHVHLDLLSGVFPSVF